MTSAIVNSWLQTLTPPTPAPKPGQGTKRGSSRYTPEQKHNIGSRICKQMLQQMEVPEDQEIIDRLKEEAGFTKPVAAEFLKRYKITTGHTR